MKKLEEAFTTYNDDFEQLNTALQVDDTNQHNIHGDNTVEEPEGEIVKVLLIAD